MRASFGGLSHHPMAKMTNTKNEKIKCHVAKLDGLMANQTKGMRKAHGTSTRKAYGI
jgi:hypothetical protein